MRAPSATCWACNGVSRSLPESAVGSCADSACGTGRPVPGASFPDVGKVASPLIFMKTPFHDSGLSEKDKRAEPAGHSPAKLRPVLAGPIFQQTARHMFRAPSSRNPVA